jgi:hypothetical protein
VLLGVKATASGKEGSFAYGFVGPSADILKADGFVFIMYEDVEDDGTDDHKFADATVHLVTYKIDTSGGIDTIMGGSFTYDPNAGYKVYSFKFTDL